MSPVLFYITTGAIWTVMIQQTTGLRFTSPLEDKVAVLARPVWWHCVAQDDTQTVTYSWTFNSQELPLRLDQSIYSNGTLYIGKLQYDDVGEYTCTARTPGVGTVVSQQARLDIAYINPTFSTQPVSQSVILGNTVTLTCAIDSLPAAKVTWTLNGDLVTMATIDVGAEGVSTLTLSPIMYHQVGVYKCMGTNQMLGVYRYSQDAQVIVQGPPVFLSKLKDVSVPRGYLATFTCSYRGNPAPEVRWLVHSESNGVISSEEILNSAKYHVYENGTFTITAVTIIDAAYYTCTVYNVFGEMSESAQLIVTGDAYPPTFTTLPVNTTVTERYNVTMACGCGGNPQPSVYWTFKDTRLVTSDYVTVSANGNLEISTTRSADMGWYTCFCSNDEGSVNQSVYLNVQVSPTITSPPTDQTVVQGDRLTLVCEAVGNPDPTVTWLTPALVTISSSTGGYILDGDGTLTITTTSLTDTGQYVCTATNTVGSTTASARVRVEATPVFTLQPVSQGVNEGDKVYLHCQATGVPTPTYTWYRDGEGDIVSTVQRQIYLNLTLVIHRVTLTDTGVYTCRVSNVRGEITAVASITVNVPPSFSVTPVNQTVKVGDTVQMTCVTNGNPVPTQKWNKDGRLLQLDTNMAVSPDQSVLTIVALRQAQYGQYTCIATNIAGVNSVSAWIKPADIPVFTVVPQDTTINQSESLLLQCQGRAVEAPSVRWYRDESGDRTLIEEDNRVTVLVNGDLSIQTVSQSDEGSYVCVLSNTAGDVETSLVVNVQVPPSIISTNSPKSVVYQSEVILVCQSTGDPSPSLQWTNPQGQVITSSPAYLMTGHTLQIVSANEQTDIGSWICKSCNLLGCDQAVVELNVEGRPIIESFVGSKTGSDIILLCIVSSTPAPTVTFTSQGQPVTSALKGHSINSNTLRISEGEVRLEYSCHARNRHGTDVSILSVPLQLEAPSITNIQSRWITLRWSDTVDQSNLLLTGSKIQQTTDGGKSWQDVETDVTNPTSVLRRNVTNLIPYKEYNFRVAGQNLLGVGMFSGKSTTVRTLPGAPTPPTNVVALLIADDIILLTWQPPQYINGPHHSVQYEYQVTKSSSPASRETVHQHGTIFHNQSRQVDITDVNEAVLYTISLSASNVDLQLTSDPVIISVDMSTPQAITKKDTESLGPDQIIAIIFGTLGGVIIVFIVLFIVFYVRHQKKTESLSFIQRQPSLDQFYMENPKNLYNKESRNSKKRRSQGFYQFDNDSSFHSSRSATKSNGQTPNKGVASDVLLVARNPLYQETELTSPSHHHSSRMASTEMLVPHDNTISAQDEIEVSPDVIADNFVLKPAHTGSDVTDTESDITSTRNDGKCNDESAQQREEDASTPLSAKNLEEDLLLIYSSMNDATTPPSESDTGLEHIYSSIYSDEQSSRSSKLPLSQTASSKKGNNSNTPKPPIRVLSPDKLRSTSPIDQGHSPVLSSRSSNHSQSPSRFMESSSKSPKSVTSSVTGNSGNSCSPKPPLKVLSLDKMRPNPDQSVHISKSPIISRSNSSTDGNYRSPPNHAHNENSVQDLISNNRTHKGLDLQNIDGIDLEQLDISMGSDSESSSLNESNSPRIPFENYSMTDYDQVKMNDQEVENVNSDSFGNKSLKERRITTEDVFSPPDLRIDDNFLTEEEVREEGRSAELY